jgi:hypothetical protein
LPPIRRYRTTSWARCWSGDRHCDWPLALELGDHVLAANLGLPERYKRSAACCWPKVAERAARGTGVPRAVLEETLALTADHDMPDQVRAKLHKAIGLPSRPRPKPSIPRPKASARAASARWSMPRSTSRARARRHAGVKKAIERLTADLKKLPSHALTPR